MDLVDAWRNGEVDGRLYELEQDSRQSDFWKPKKSEVSKTIFSDFELQVSDLRGTSVQELWAYW